MTRQLRTLGGAICVLGLLALLAYAVPPLRAVWPWFIALPGLVQLGVGALVLGALLVVVSLVIERFEDIDHDRGLQAP